MVRTENKVDASFAELCIPLSVSFNTVTKRGIPKKHCLSENISNKHSGSQYCKEDLKFTIKLKKMPIENAD